MSNSINVWPLRGSPVGSDKRAPYKAAMDAQDESSERANRVTWLTAGEERVAAIVPVEAAEAWLG